MIKQNIVHSEYLQSGNMRYNLRIAKLTGSRYDARIFNYDGSLYSHRIFKNMINANAYLNKFEKKLEKTWIKSKLNEAK